jgi:23S rRNA (cytosine1962-C5)-methyltransferase
MLAFEDAAIDEAFFTQRIRQALSLRKPFLNPKTNACRVIHSESDFLPGLTADLYGQFLVIQIQAAGMELWRETVIKILAEELKVRGIYEKDESEWRKLEGLQARSGVVWGEAPGEIIEILENGIKFAVDIKSGQKTGFYLDQRGNRKLVGDRAAGKKLLNCFSYTGGFSVYAARGGAAQTISVDSSETALKLAEKNFEVNQIDPKNHRQVHTDVFQYLRQGQETFDFIVLDPPAFCQHKAQVTQASRAYKDINLFAIKRVVKGGYLFTASCSSFIDPHLFQQIIFAAAKDAGRDLRILAKTGHSWDHPVNIYFPEGEYLKGFFCQVD